jgi:hypothetical protein
LQEKFEKYEEKMNLTTDHTNHTDNRINVYVPGTG